MAAEQFSLCWNNFHSNLSSGFHSLYQSEDFVDVTLAAEGRYLKAHKMVLSVCSQYFKELLHVNPCKHPIVILKDVSYNALRDLLQFMYLGEVSVSQEELSNLMKIAELLQIKGLTDSNMDPMNQNGIKNILVTDVKSLSEPRTIKRSKSKKIKTEKSETPAKMAKPNSSPEPSNSQSQNRLEEQTINQLPPPPNLLALPVLFVSQQLKPQQLKPQQLESQLPEPQLPEPQQLEPRQPELQLPELQPPELQLSEPLITPKIEPADESSESCRYSEHSLPAIDIASMLDTSLSETLTDVGWKIELQKMYQSPGANTQDVHTESFIEKHKLIESTNAPIHHFQKWVGVKPGKTRKRCAHCYKKIKEQFGTNMARSKTKQVDTFCASCDYMSAMCLDCFKEIHD